MNQLHSAGIRRFIFWMVFILVFFISMPVIAGNTVEHGLYAGLLKKYVKDGVVDYQGFKNEESRLDEYLKILEKTDSKTLDRNEQLAFYINAYNSWTIKLILSGYPGIKSIKDLGSLFQSPWKKKICRIDGDIISLDAIEHQIIRPVFKDPRVHFAINCASKGCPPLIFEPYTGLRLDHQLESSARAFINDPQQNRMNGNTLYVSSIFKWFSEDFEDDILGFVSKYASGELKSQLIAKAENIKIEYLDYDWSLNGK